MDSVAAAFMTVPRKTFLPRGAHRLASYDGPILIGHGQTNSQPSTVWAMLRLLEVRRGDRVLDVGAGSGWTTALLAHLTGPDGLVVGVELVPELAAWGEANVRRTPFGWASIREPEDGVLGAPELAPYDRILCSANARRLPPALVEQLSAEGRLVLPVASTMTLVAAGRLSTHGSYRFVPLIEPVK